MANQADNQPFSGIIQKALAARGSQTDDYAKDPEHNAPRYVVGMCRALTQALHDAGNLSVSLAEVIRLESTCTGADYSDKLSLRIHRLSMNAAA